MNEHVYGNDEHGLKGQWVFPMAKGQLYMKSMTGVTAWKVMNALSDSADIAFAARHLPTTQGGIRRAAAVAENRRIKQKWNNMMKHFIEFWKLVDNKDGDLTDDEINRAHFHGVSFFAIYVLMFPERITNYMHLIGAGHITYFLDKYRNLYRFSQQGWEALNKLIKSHYHHKTNHGGCQGNTNSAMVRGQHLLPIANLITRRHAWLRTGQGGARPGGVGGGDEEGGSPGGRKSAGYYLIF